MRYCRWLDPFGWDIKEYVIPPYMQHACVEHVRRDDNHFESGRMENTVRFER